MSSLKAFRDVWGAYEEVNRLDRLFDKITEKSKILYDRMTKLSRADVMRGIALTRMGVTGDVPGVTRGVLGMFQPFASLFAAAGLLYSAGTLIWSLVERTGPHQEAIDRYELLKNRGYYLG